MKLKTLILSAVLTAATASVATAADMVHTAEGVVPTTQAVIPSAEAGARSVAGGVEVYNPTFDSVDAHVYSITGTLVAHSTAAPGETIRFDLNPGVYIVRVANTAVRLLVR